MATDIPDQLPDSAQIAQFTRITSRISFKNGTEATIDYDERVAVRDDETHFRRFTERNAETPLKDGEFDLRSDLPQRTILRVNGYPKQEIQFREFIESQRLYLVTQDAGRSVRILKPEELPRFGRATEAVEAQRAGEPTGEAAEEPGEGEEIEEGESVEVGEWDEPEPISDSQDEPTVSPEDADEEREKVTVGEWDAPDDETEDANDETEAVEA